MARVSAWAGALGALVLLTTGCQSAQGGSSGQGGPSTSASSASASGPAASTTVVSTPAVPTVTSHHMAPDHHMTPNGTAPDHHMTPNGTAPPGGMMSGHPGPGDHRPSNGRVRLVNLRTGVHDDRDRVVLEFDTAAAPPFRQSRTGDPTHCGSGLPVTMGAAAYEVISVDAVDLFDGQGRPFYAGPRTLPAPRPNGAGGVAGVELTCQFEGVLTAAIGLREPGANVHVSTLPNPGRIVVDVAR